MHARVVRFLQCARGEQLEHLAVVRQHEPSTLKERAPGWLHARGVPVVAPPPATSELLAADNTVEGGGLRIIRASQLCCRVLLQGLPGATFFIVAPCCSVPHHPGFWEDAAAFGSAAVAARD